MAGDDVHKFALAVYKPARTRYKLARDLYTSPRYDLYKLAIAHHKPAQRDYKQG